VIKVVWKDVGLDGEVGASGGNETRGHVVNGNGRKQNVF